MPNNNTNASIPSTNLARCTVDGEDAAKNRRRYDAGKISGSTIEQISLRQRPELLATGYTLSLAHG